MHSSSASCLVCLNIPWPPTCLVRLTQLHADGRVLRTLHDPTGKVVHVGTSALEHRGMLLIGSLHQSLKVLQL